jgi:hypothetical protein
MAYLVGARYVGSSEHVRRTGSRCITPDAANTDPGFEFDCRQPEKDSFAVEPDGE